jgi:sulfatase maturation enzyme AslB (radical SAM superfamily)
MSLADAVSMPLTRPSGAPPAFHVLVKPTGAICNLDCKYCFFLSKEMLYPGSRFRMADELLETYIRQLLEAHQTPEVAIAWQGGEPTLMGLDFFKRSVELAEKHKQPGQKVLHTIQTNGTKLDDEWCAFFKQHEFLVGLSVDGPRELHDAYRVDKGGQGTFDQVMRGLAFLKAHAVDFNILCTVHAANGDHGPGGLSVLPRRPGNRLHPVHPDCRAGHPRAAAHGQPGLGRYPSAPAAVPARRRSGHRAFGALGPVGAFHDRRLR